MPDWHDSCSFMFSSWMSMLLSVYGAEKGKVWSLERPEEKVVKVKLKPTASLTQQKLKKLNTNKRYPTDKYRYRNSMKSGLFLRIPIRAAIIPDSKHSARKLMPGMTTYCVSRMLRNYAHVAVTQIVPRPWPNKYIYRVAKNINVNWLTDWLNE